MYRIFYVIAVVSIHSFITAQDLEVVGKAKITSMDAATSSAKLVAQETDGTLSVITGTAKVKIGDIVHGGIVFYVDESGQHGLVADDADFTSRWHAGTFGYTHARSREIYAGQMNTAVIVAAHVAIGDDLGAYAAKICMQIEKNGYGDWFLPAPKTLQLMYNNLHLSGLGGFSNAGYWSSRETTDTNSMLVDFGDDGLLKNNGKTAVYRVRAVRRF